MRISPSSSSYEALALSVADAPSVDSHSILLSRPASATGVALVTVTNCAHSVSLPAASVAVHMTMVLKEMMRHATVQTTDKSYAHQRTQSTAAVIWGSVEKTALTDKSTDIPVAPKK